MDRYAHVGLVDTAAALDMLPELPATAPKKESEPVQATGTDGAPGPRLDRALTKPVRFPASSVITPETTEGGSRRDFLNPWHLRWTVCGAPPVCGEWRRWRLARRNGLPSLSFGYAELLASVAGKVARSPTTACGSVHELGPPNSLFEKVSESAERRLPQAFEIASG
jgi:hypothetical protein